MKIAEVLIRKGVVKKQIAELEATLADGIRVPESEQADQEDVDPLLESISAKYRELYDIGCTISTCNRLFEITPNQTLDQALVLRDVLIKRLTKLREFHKLAKGDRYTRDSETKYVVRLPQSRTRSMIDKLQTELHDIETKIQIANWQYDVPEKCV